MSQTLVGIALVFCWALLLSARSLAAAVGSAYMGGSYHAKLEQIGNLMPFSAWAALVVGGFVLIREANRDKSGVDTGSEETGHLK